MNAVFLTLFVSGVLVLGMLVLFAFLLSQRSHEQSDRLSLLPLQDEPSDRTDVRLPPSAQTLPSGQGISHERSHNHLR